MTAEAIDPVAELEGELQAAHQAYSAACQPPPTSFSLNPICTVESLARLLQHPASDLEAVAATAEERYKIGKRIPKSDGSVRITYDAKDPLKIIQGKIQMKLLNQVRYPPYLQGGIKDPSMRRGQKTNARFHVGQRTHVSEDIKRFFPSVSKQVVFDIWNKLFSCPPRIALLLTQLTMKDGGLPEGAKTSTLLGNLVFWDTESELVHDFHERGIIYSRLVDDICCSSRNDLSKRKKTYIIRRLHAMVRKKGLRLNRKKQTIAGAGGRHVTTKLIVNAKTALPNERRSEIRADVHKLALVPKSKRKGKRYAKDHNRARGKVAYLKQHHLGEAEKLQATLRDIAPPKTAPRCT